MKYPFQVFVKATAMPYLWTCMRYRIHYVGDQNRKKYERIKGGAIVAPNHRTIFDVALVGHVFLRKEARVFAAEVLYEKSVFFRIFLNWMGFIKVDRTVLDLSSVAKGAEVLKEQGMLLLFPEGRIPRKDETPPIKFQPGAIMLSLKTGKPILPVYLKGGCGFLKRADVVIGEPILGKDLMDDSLSYEESLKQACTRLREQIIALQKTLDEG